MMRMLKRLEGRPRERLAEWVSAASYGTVLVLAALTVIHPDDVADGLGWEIVTGVGLATWVAHLYAEVVGDHVRQTAPVARKDATRLMRDALPILLATVLPAVILLFGRLDVLADRVALWVSIGVATLQLMSLGGVVGFAVSPRRLTAWLYAATTAALGLAVVGANLILGH
jgi:hypothetical protein